jgi:hypothetical protein
MRVAPSLAVSSLLVVLAFVAPARAEPWFGWGDARLEEAYIDGDFDVEDVTAMHLGRGHVATSALHGRSWLTLKGFYAERPNGLHEVGAIAVLGIALDKVAAGPSHITRDRPILIADGNARAAPSSTPPSPSPSPSPSASPSPSPPPPPPPRRAPLPVTPAVARSCVVAAWRASGLGADDARIDAMIARARQSAVLPEARFRAMRLVDSSAKTDTTTTTDTQRLYDAAGANLWLEARLTWRLDRLIYADDEPTIERVRLERQDARARITARVLDALFAWQRAWVELAASLDGSREQTEAVLRMGEAEAALDVLTGGWFVAWRAERGSTPR